ncbi:MAG: hypothetical protein R3B94_14915 [Hyphomonas sp.]
MPRAYELDEQQGAPACGPPWARAGRRPGKEAEQAMRYIYNHLAEDDPRRDRFRAIGLIGRGDEAAPAPQAAPEEAPAEYKTFPDRNSRTYFWPMISLTFSGRASTRQGTGSRREPVDRFRHERGV